MQIVHADLSSSYVTMAADAASLELDDGVAKLNAAFKIVPEADYVALASKSLQYTYDRSPAAAGRDAALDCDDGQCAAGVVGGAMQGGVGGAAAGGAAGSLFGPGGAAAGVVLGGAAGAIGGGLSITAPTRTAATAAPIRAAAPAAAAAARATALSAVVLAELSSSKHNF